MNANELLDIIGEARGQYVMEAQQHRQTTASKSRRRLPAKRIVLIAAVIALLVAMVGFAAIVLNLDSLNLGEFSFDTGFGEKQTMDLISLQGVTGSKNYLAAQEWQNFLAEYDPDGSLLKQADNDLYFPPQEYESYICYTEEMVQKVDEICEKYDLDKLGPVQLCYNPWDVLDAVGVQKIFDPDHAGINNGDGYYYRDGTFQIAGTMELCGEDAVWNYPVDFQYRSVKKTSFDGVFINVWDTEQYEQWNYKRADGTELLLALSADHALIIADNKDAFVTMSIQSTRVGDVLLGEQQMDKTVMEAIAEVMVLHYEAKRTASDSIETALPQETALYSDFSDYIRELTDKGEALCYALENVDGLEDDELLIGDADGTLREILTIRDGIVQTMGTGGMLYVCEYRPLNPVMDINDPNYVYIHRIIEQESDVGGAVQHYYTYITEDGVGVISDVLMECADGTYARSDNGDAAASNWQTITEGEYQQIKGQYPRMEPVMKPIDVFFGTHTPDYTLFESAYLPIAGGEVNRGWDSINAFLTELGYVCIVGEGNYSVNDPMNPGSYLCGELTTENGTVEIVDVRYHLVLGDAVREVRTAFNAAGVQHIVNAGFLRSGVWVPDISDQTAFIQQYP